MVVVLYRFKGPVLQDAAFYLSEVSTEDLSHTLRLCSGEICPLLRNHLLALAAFGIWGVWALASLCMLPPGCGAMCSLLSLVPPLLYGEQLRAAR